MKIGTSNCLNKSVATEAVQLATGPEGDALPALTDLLTLFVASQVTAPVLPFNVRGFSTYALTVFAIMRDWEKSPMESAPLPSERMGTTRPVESQIPVLAK
jgi:hypothetical protein